MTSWTKATTRLPHFTPQYARVTVTLSGENCQRVQPDSYTEKLDDAPRRAYIEGVYTEADEVSPKFTFFV
jgi:hypothetical protein